MRQLTVISFQHLIDMLYSSVSYAQESNSWQLEKMPAELEADFALSALLPTFATRPPFIC